MQTRKSTVYLARAAKASPHADERLMKAAEAVAASIAVPPGIEFARFRHAGRSYALSARLIVEVDVLDARVPDVVVREGEMRRPSKRGGRRA